MFILIICMNIPVFSRGDKYKVSRYDFNVTYDGGLELNIKAKMSIVKYQPIDTIKLLIDPNIKTKYVALMHKGKYDRINYTSNGDSINLILPFESKGERIFNISFDYSLTLDSLTNEVVALYPWYPYLWNCVSKYKLTVSSINSFSFYSQGNLINEHNEGSRTSYTYKMNIGIPRLSLVMAPEGALRLYQVKNKNAVLKYYFMQKDTVIGKVFVKRFIDETNEAFNYYCDLIGPYQYENLTFIETCSNGGVNSQPCFIIMGPDFIKYYSKLLADFPPHEIAHQWAGSGFFVNHGDIRNGCIYEPLAEYLKLMYYEKFKGRSYMEKELNNNILEYKNDYEGKDEDKSLLESGSSRITYIKGPVIMDKIRRTIGDDKWTLFLRKLYLKYRGKILSYDDFVNCLSSINHDCANDFLGWVKTKGLPEN